jgi:flagellar basal-body rod protein FlgB
MTLANLPVFSALKQRMHWHDARQHVLAENVANANMPGFTPRDLVATGRQQQLRPAGPVQVALTSAAHIAGRPVAGSGPDGAREQPGWETTPDGNSVVLEEQMMKLTQNQMDHQMVTTLYSRGLALLRASLRAS